MWLRSAETAGTGDGIARAENDSGASRTDGVGLVRGYLVGMAWRLKGIGLALGASTLGVVLGLLLTSPLTDLTTSIIVVTTYLVTIVGSPLSGLLLWMLTSPFAQWTVNIPLGAGIPDLSPDRFCAAFLCVVVLAQVAIHKRKLAPPTGLDYAAILFLGGVSVSSLGGLAGWRSIQLVFDLYAVPILGYFLAKNLVGNRKSLDVVLNVVLMVGVIAALYSFYEHGTGQILFVDEQPTFFEYKDSGLQVLRGLLGRSDHFGALFSMVIPLTVYLLLNPKSQTGTVAYATALAVLLVALVFTYKRTAWIAFLVSMVTMQAFLPRLRRVSIPVLLVLLLVIGATWGSVSRSSIVTGRLQGQGTAVAGRTEGWTAAFRLWTRKPLLGYGFRQYESVAQAARIHDDHIESEYFDILFSAGLVGFLPYMALFGLMLRDSIRLFRLSGGRQGFFVDRGLVVAFWGLFLGYLINYISARASNAFVSLVFYVLAGAIVGSQCSSMLWLRRGTGGQSRRSSFVAGKGNSLSQAAAPKSGRRPLRKT